MDHEKSTNRPRTLRKAMAEILDGLETRLETGGLVVDLLSGGSCPDCGGREWVVIPDGGAGKARPCGCVTDRPIEERLRRMGVPRDLVSARWEDFAEPDGHLRPDLSTFPGTDTCVTFLGSTGTSKSFAAVSILREWVLTGKRCRYLHADELVRQARECFANDVQPDAIIDSLLRFDLVVLDEAYGDRRTDFSDDMTSLLIRRCLRAGTPLVITTNQTDEQLAAIEPKVASRALGRGALPFDFSDRPEFRKVAPEDFKR